MAAGRALVLLALLLTPAACGGDSGAGDGGSAPAVGGEDAAEVAYQEAYADAWVKSCKAATVNLRKELPGRVSGIKCDRPVEQMEGNTTFDVELAEEEGRRQGTFDGCAYAWDEAYAGRAEVEPRC